MMLIINPFALHITWTTYGTWLPGDERGYVSNTLHEAGGYTVRQNEYGTEVTRDDAYTRQRAQALLAHEPTYLNKDEARIVAESLVKLADKHKWKICRAAIMANHVHVVLMDCPEEGPEVRRLLKGVAQAALTESTGKRVKWFTRGGSDRYKKDEVAILTAIRYVADQEYKLMEIIDNIVVDPDVMK